MRHRLTWLWRLLAVVRAAGPPHAQSAPASPSAPLIYVAVPDRNVYRRFPRHTLGPAGYRFTALPLQVAQPW